MALVESTTPMERRPHSTPTERRPQSPRKQKQQQRGRMRDLLLMCVPHHHQHTATDTTIEKNDRYSKGGPTINSHKNQLSYSSDTAYTAKQSVSSIDPTSTRTLPSQESIIHHNTTSKRLSSSSSPLPLPRATASKVPAPCPYQLKKNQYFDELGYMHFDCGTLGEAQPLAIASGKPMLAIEVRIPGDTDVGRDIFCHPLIVEACQSLFVPVVRIIEDKQDESPRQYNIRSGPTFVQRAPSGKPCRTKVAFLDPHSGEFLATPLYGDMLTPVGMVSSMAHVLANWSSCFGVPKYLSLLCEEEMGKIDGVNKQRPRPKDYVAFFALEDSAKGEVEFAGLDGVFATRVVFISGRRAVEVSYDSCKMAHCSLIRHALNRDMVIIAYYKTNDEKRAAEVEIARANVVSVGLEKFEGGIQSDNDPKRALRKTPLRFVPMTDIQATRANRLVHLGRFDEAVHLLSPQQGAILMQAMRLSGSFHEVVDVPIGVAWTSVSERKFPVKKQKEPEEED